MSPYRFGITITSYSSGFCTSCIAMLSTMRSSNSISGNSLLTSSATRSQSPSVCFMMLALCTAVTLWRPFSIAHLKAKRNTRCVPKMVMGLMLMPASATNRAPAEAFDIGDQFERSRLSLGELDACVKVFGVLADDHQVDVLITAAHTGI